MALSGSETLSVFLKGDVPNKPITMETSHPSSPPKPLLIFTPTATGKYPVILFFHGTYLRNYFYSDLFQHISSHGFIIVVPQLYQYILPSGIDEVESAGKVTNWLPENLQSMLPDGVQADLESLSLAGHSRGGKVAFALALGYGNTSLKFSVLVGIDPVAGVSKCYRTSPHILTYEPRSFNFSVPVTVIGTGLGDQPKCPVSPPCALKELNHTEFFSESRPPCAHFVAAEYGHMDMLNDELPGPVGALSNCMCVNGKGPRDPMRRCVGGIVVSFLKDRLGEGGEGEDFAKIVQDHSVAPVKLDQVEYTEA